MSTASDGAFRRALDRSAATASPAPPRLRPEPGDRCTRILELDLYTGTHWPRLTDARARLTIYTHYAAVTAAGAADCPQWTFRLEASPGSFRWSEWETDDDHP